MDRKPDREKKSCMIAVRCTPDEFARLEEKSEAAGMKPGRLAVHAALNLEITPPVPALNRRTYSELGRLGSNLNQIAARLNRENKLSVSGLLATLRDLSQQLAATRKQLIGAKS